MNSLQKIADTSATASSTQSKAGTIVSQHMNLQNTHMTLQENQRDFPNLSIPQMNSSVRTSGISILSFQFFHNEVIKPADSLDSFVMTSVFRRRPLEPADTAVHIIVIHVVIDIVPQL